MNTYKLLVGFFFVFLSFTSFGQDSKFDTSPSLIEEINDYNSPISFEEDLLIGQRIDINNDGQFQNTDSIEYSYNIDNNLEMSLVINYNETTQTWNNFSRTLNEYDANGNRTSFTSQIWETDMWVLNYKLIYSYNELDQLIQLNRQELLLGEIEDDYQVFYTFNDENLLSRFFVQQSVNGEWIDAVDAFISYDSNGYRTERLQKRWDGVEWIDLFLTEYTHDINGNRTEEERLRWVDDEWEPEVKYIAEFNSENLITSRVGQRANQDLVYENDSETVYIYNENNLIETETYSLWNISVWKENQNINYIYDDRENIIYNLTQQSPDGLNEPEDLIQRFYYYQYVSNIEFNDNVLSFEVFPNPSDGQINIDYQDHSIKEVRVSLFTIDGKKVTSADIQSPQGQIRLNFDGLESGNYIVKIQSDKSSVSKKIFIQQ